MRKAKKIVLVTNIPNQYRIPLFNELAFQLAQKNWQLIVIFGARGYNRRKSIVNLSECNFTYHVLESGLFSPIEKRSGFIFYGGLTRKLRSIKPDKTIVSGFSLSTIKACGLSIVTSQPFYILSGTTEKAQKSSFARLQMRKFLARKAAGFIAYGSLAKQYLASIGVPEKEVTCMGNTVDTSYFKEKTQALKDHRSKGKNHQLTYIGYVNSRKNVHDLILVLKRLTQLRKDVMLNIVGDGEDLESIKTKVTQLNLTKHVTFHGFKQKESLPEILAITDLFLFQTNNDIWGLVLNEAMAAELPCFASINAGATYDLIEEGKTGYAVDFAQHEKVAHQIHTALLSPEKLKEVGIQAGTFISEEYSLEQCARRIISGVKI